MKYYFLAITFLITSCDSNQSNKIIYFYDGVTITRLDRGRVSYFYYGDYSNSTFDKVSPVLKASYERGTDVMNAYLVFEKNKKVRFIKMHDKFEELKKDSLFYMYEFLENIAFIQWEDSAKLKPDNVIRLDDAPNIERELNKQLKSKVIATYF